MRVCKPGGTIALLSWTPEGMIGALAPERPARSPRRPRPAPSRRRCGAARDHLRDLFGDRVEWGTLEHDNLEIDAFGHPREYGEHFKDRYGPTIVARDNAVKNGQEAEFDEAVETLEASGTAAPTTTRTSRRSTSSRSARGLRPGSAASRAGRGLSAPTSRSCPSPR